MKNSTARTTRPTTTSRTMTRAPMGLPLLRIGELPQELPHGTESRGVLRDGTGEEAGEFIVIEPEPVAVRTAVDGDRLRTRRRIDLDELLPAARAAPGVRVPCRQRGQRPLE